MKRLLSLSAGLLLSTPSLSANLLSKQYIEDANAYRELIEETPIVQKGIDFCSSVFEEDEIERVSCESELIGMFSPQHCSIIELTNGDGVKCLENMTEVITNYELDPSTTFGENYYPLLKLIGESEIDPTGKWKIVVILLIMVISVLIIKDKFNS